LAGEKSLSVRSSPATENQCPKCGIGRLRPTEDGLQCYNCSFTQYAEDPPEDSSESLFTKRQKEQILDALQEQYMRARGNARRSKLESSKVINEEHAAFINGLMSYVKGL
jgi:hypothetical protein